jgi:hypothetical protein
MFSTPDFSVTLDELHVEHAPCNLTVTTPDASSNPTYSISPPSSCENAAVQGQRQHSSMRMCMRMHMDEHVHKHAMHLHQQFCSCPCPVLRLASSYQANPLKHPSLCRHTRLHTLGYEDAREIYLYIQRVWGSRYYLPDIKYCVYVMQSAILTTNRYCNMAIVVAVGTRGVVTRSMAAPAHQAQEALETDILNVSAQRWLMAQNGRIPARRV